MGLYNYGGSNLPTPLKENRCLICGNAMNPVNRTPDLDAFQYICNNCNANVIIEISGSLLASYRYFELQNNNNAKSLIRKRIKNTTKTNFPITTALVSEYI